jgi:hypothetical protein
MCIHMALKTLIWICLKMAHFFKQSALHKRSIANDLWQLGFKSVSELKNQDPEKLYEDLCTQTGCRLDRCLLYVFRCAVYFASNKTHDPALLKWWNWKD